jgi:hypothetical protein
MVHGMVVGLLVTLTSVTSAQSSEAGVTSGLGESVTISGSVLDAESGEPIPGAIVRLQIEGQRTLRAEADHSGGFTIESPAGVGTAVLQAWAEGFLPEVQRFRFDCSRDREDSSHCLRAVDLHLQSGKGLFEPSASTCSLEGSVLGIDGRSLRGARVFLEGRAEGVEADEHGWFSVSEVKAGLRIARAVLIGMAPNERMILVSCPTEGAPSVVGFRLVPQPIDLEPMVVRSRSGGG